MPYGTARPASRSSNSGSSSRRPATATSLWPWPSIPVARSVLYSFVSMDSQSTIYGAVAKELAARGYWRQAPNTSHHRMADVILAGCHGKKVRWSEVGVNRVQVINYLRGSRSFTLKAELVLLLRDSMAENPSDEPLSPLSYILFPRRAKGRIEQGDERDEYLWEMHLREKAGVDNVWICKVTHFAKGNGVEVFDDGYDVCDYVDNAYSGTGYAVVVQKYVENPLLIHGFKFDIRVWVLVDMNLGVFMYKDGVLRLSSTPYNPSDLADIFSHLTNHCIQAKSPNYENLVEGNEMFFLEFSRFLRREHPGVDFKTSILDQMRSQVIRTLQGAWPELRQNQPGGFQLYGFDFMIDTDYRTWLLEVNGAPAAAEKLRGGIASSIVNLCIDSRFPPPPEWGLEREASRVHGFEELCSIASLDCRSGYR